ncbi:MAG: carboxypeptidase regulatory-like domain-containing protein [Bryobacteraceae bacterium]
MKHLKLSRFLIVCLLAFAFAMVAVAQEAAIVGTVTDPSGAAVPGVQISITNADTGQVRQITSNDAGQYVVPSLGVGKYTVKAASSGFKAFEQNDVVLNVGDRLRVDITLQVGQSKESVNVEAVATRVQADSGEVSEIVTGNQVLDLSMNGRNLYELATLIPGASSALPAFNGPSAQGSSAIVSFNGQRPDHNVYLVDGGEDYDRGSGGKFEIMPSLDAIAEFRTLTSNYAADYGLSSGGTLTMVFKSGTKDFHGGMWEFFRNDALDAANFFTNANNGTTQELRYNVFGFNLGGPVILPHYNHDRNKTFFFYNEEWRREVQGGNFNAQTPSAAMLTGVFPYTINVPTAAQLNPTELARFTALGLVPGQPFPNNTIPSSLISPVAQAFLATGALNAQNSGTATSPTFQGGNNTPTTVGEQIVRIDHQFSDKFWIFGHWVSEQLAQGEGTPLWSGDSYPSINSVFNNPSYSGVVHATYAISPNVVNEVAFNYNGNTIDNTIGGIYQRTSDFDPPTLFGANVENRLPAVTFQGSGINSSFSTGNASPWNNAFHDYQIREDLSWTKGRHSFKMGFQYMLSQKTQELFGFTNGQYTFNGTYTGVGFADFLLGYASSYNETAVQDSGNWADNSFAGYFQDNWRVNNRLTLNLGMRWEGIPHTYEENNRMSNFYPNLYSLADAGIVNPQTGILSPNSPGLGAGKGVLSNALLYTNGMAITGQDGAPTDITNNHWNNWAPRFGFAFDPTGSGKTVIRGGFGIMYERVQGNDVYNMGPNVPFSEAPTLSNVYLSNPAVSVLTGTAAVAPILPPSVQGISLTNYKNPTSDQWSAGVQREVWHGAVLQASYVGNMARHQNYLADINSPLPNNPLGPEVVAGTLNINAIRPYLGYGSILMGENAGNSKYNALQTELRMQATKGLTLQVAYTYSKAYDDTAGSANGGNGGDQDTIENPYNLAYDYGISTYNRTNIFLVDYVYNLPFFKDTSNKALHTMLGGWVLSGIVTAESGLPNNVTMSGATLGMSNYTNRPNEVAGVTYPGSVQEFFNPAAFSYNTSVCATTICAFGNAPKNAVIGPGRTNFDTSLFKDFSGIKWFNPEGATLEFRAETYNTFNHTQFDNINTTYGSGQFGQITSAYDPRVIQLGLKFLF